MTERDAEDTVAESHSKDLRVEQEARAEARRVVNADVVLAALRTIGVGLAAARGAHERAVAVSNARARLARLVDQIEGQARPASPATREMVTEEMVARANDAYLAAMDADPYDRAGRMRAALEAALTEKGDE